MYLTVNVALYKGNSTNHVQSYHAIVTNLKKVQRLRSRDF